jgi:hypothetical protein
LANDDLTGTAPAGCEDVVVLPTATATAARDRRDHDESDLRIGTLPEIRPGTLEGEGFPRH